MNSGAKVDIRFKISYDKIMAGIESGLISKIILYDEGTSIEIEGRSFREVVSCIKNMGIVPPGFNLTQAEIVASIKASILLGILQAEELQTGAR